MLPDIIAITANGGEDVPKRKEIKIPDSQETRLEIVTRANKGDAKAIAALPEVLDRAPEIREAIERIVEGAVERRVIESMHGDSVVVRETLRRKLADMRMELEGPSPSPIERLLVDRVVACWLQTEAADYRATPPKGCTLAQANSLSKRQDRAHRRFLSAMKTLATVRKLALPVL